MNLGTLIDALAAENPNAQIVYSDGRVPERFYSWRGRYDELTLCPFSMSGEQITVGTVLGLARAAVGEVFTGYKGGDYTMSLGTPVWADAWGAYECWGIVGVTCTDRVVTLVTADLSDYS